MPEQFRELTSSPSLQDADSLPVEQARAARTSDGLTVQRELPRMRSYTPSLSV